MTYLDQAHPNTSPQRDNKQMDSKPKSERVCTVLPAVWKYALKDRARKRGITFADEMRIAVSEYIERESISV